MKVGDYELQIYLEKTEQGRWRLAGWLSNEIEGFTQRASVLQSGDSFVVVFEFAKPEVILGAYTKAA